MYVFFVSFMFLRSLGDIERSDEAKEICNKNNVIKYPKTVCIKLVYRDLFNYRCLYNSHLPSPTNFLVRPFALFRRDPDIIICLI